jgi:hypothetical protein
MAGLQLRAGTFGGPMRQGAVPHAAGVSAGAPTISQKAFGVTSQQSPGAGPSTAGFGTVALGLAGVAILVYLWWSLPR